MPERAAPEPRQATAPGPAREELALAGRHAELLNAGAQARLGPAAQLLNSGAARGTDIHLASGQERHLPHEAWHVVQQKQGRVRGTAQLKRIPLQGGASRIDEENDIYLGNDTVSVGSMWQKVLGDQATRSAQIGAIAGAAAEIGGAIRSLVHGSWNFDADKIGDAHHNRYDPVRVRIKGKYTKPAVGEGPATSETLALDYHFGSGMAGYVVKVVDTGKALNHAMLIPNRDEEGEPARPGATEYSSVHRPHDDATIERADDADAVTKLAGEGARWRAIRANVGKLKDTSLIYSNEASGEIDPDVRYLEFKVLWKSWVATFGGAYGIADSAVVEKLKGANVTIKTADGEVASAVGSAASSAMRHAKDISVDEQKPQDQDGLAVETVRRLHYRRNAALDFTQALGDHLDAFRGAFEQEEREALSVQYVGGRLFACVAALAADAKPDLDGYTTVSDEDLDIEYPAYRAGQIAGRLNALAATGGGKQAYQEEWGEKYTEAADQLILAIAVGYAVDNDEDPNAVEVGDSMVGGIDVRKLVNELDDDLVLGALDDDEDAMAELKVKFDQALEAAEPKPEPEVAKAEKGKGKGK